MHLKNAVPTTLTEQDVALLDSMPKATIYAIAKDLAQRCVGVEDEGAIRAELVSTWRILHANQIVSRGPRKGVQS